MMFSSTTLLMYLKPDQSASVHSIPVNATSHGVEIDYLDCSILYQISLETAESLSLKVWLFFNIKHALNKVSR